ncbi:MAG TPA: hypothetical protein VEC39_06160 [Vicinamibacterales bacterium]|nr:hypothetical protein [Vicinamibacterales bacterium]
MGRLVAIALLLCAAGCSRPPAPAMPPFDTTVTMKDLMANVLDRNADVVWESVGTIITAEGSFERVPGSDEEWDAVRAAAVTIAEAGNSLMLPQRSSGNDEWVKLAAAMMEQARRVIKATEARDKNGVFDTGADLYDSCVNCHKRFDPAITSVQ